MSPLYTRTPQRALVSATANQYTAANGCVRRPSGATTTRPRCGVIVGSGHTVTSSFQCSGLIAEYLRQSFTNYLSGMLINASPGSSNNFADCAEVHRCVQQCCHTPRTLGSVEITACCFWGILARRPGSFHKSCPSWHRSITTTQSAEDGCAHRSVCKNCPTCIWRTGQGHNVRDNGFIGVLIRASSAFRAFATGRFACVLLPTERMDLWTNHSQRL